MQGGQSYLNPSAVTVLQKFQIGFDTMKDHPDIVLIKELTKMTELNIELAYNFVAIIVGRLISPTIHAAFKLPIFYLMDSIMKNVGGPYAALFEKQLSEIYSVVFTGLHEKDRKKLDFLLDTWRDRRFLQGDLPAKMKLQLYPANVSYQSGYSNQNVSQLNVAAPGIPFVRSSSGGSGKGRDGSSAAMFADLVRNDMISMLHQMYADMGIPKAQQISLDGLATANPDLWGQLRAKAEDNAALLMSRRSNQLGPSSSNFGAPQQPQLQSSAQRGLRDDSAFSSKKRMLEDGFREGNAAPHQYQHTNRTTDYDTGGRFAGEQRPSSALQQRDATLRDDKHDVARDGGAHRVLVNGFICETTVVLDADRCSALLAQVDCRYRDLPPAMPAGFHAAARRVVGRLDGYMRDIFTPPQLPQILFGPLPLEPVHADSRIGEVRVVKPRLPMPVFRPEELGRNPEAALRALYADKPHQFHEDGLRFATLAALQRHTDEFLERKKLLLRRKEGGAQVREYREWYCSPSQWVSDFSKLSLSGAEGGGGNAVQAAASAATGKDDAGAEEEFMLPADEAFPRCPVSREMFECAFDEEEGEMMYLNAAKVLVRAPVAAAVAAGGDELFALGRPTEEPNVHYLIVHKLLVLDNWLALGQAVSLRNAVTRYEQMGGGADVVQQLRRAAGDDESEEDIFVHL